MTTQTFNTTNVDLTSTTVTDDVLKAGIAKATTFKVDQADLLTGGTVIGSTGNDTLIVVDTAFDLTGTTLTSIESLKAGSASATTFLLDQNTGLNGANTGPSDFGSVQSISGSTGTDKLIGTESLVLNKTSITSIEILSTMSTSGGLFVVDQADLAAKGSIEGGFGSDTLASASGALNLISTVLSSVEILRTASASATTLTVDQADLAAGGSVIGGSPSDTLAVKDLAVDLTSTTISSIETLKAGSAGATTFTIDSDDLIDLGTIVGSSGADALIVAGATTVDFTSTTLSSIEALKAGTTAATTFVLDAKDLAANGTITGTGQDDTLKAAGTALDLSSTSLTSVEILKAATPSGTTGTTFTVDTNDLASGGSVYGDTGIDTLATKSSGLDVSSTTLDSIEILKANGVGAKITIDTANLPNINTIAGGTGSDTLIIAGTTSVDLSSTVVTSVEKLQAALTTGTTFIVDQADLAGSGSLIGSTSSIDTVQAAGTSLNLGSSSLSSVEVISAGVGIDTTLLVDTKDLADKGSVLGDGDDTLAAAGSSLDLTSTTLSGIDMLQAGTASATTFTVDQADLDGGLPVNGSSGNDTLIIKGTDYDLTSTVISSVEILKAGSSLATTFKIDQDDLASKSSVIGSSGSDTLEVQGTVVDLSSTALTSVEKIQASTASDTTFVVDANDLAAKGSVSGSTGNDTLQVTGGKIDLTSTTLSSIERIESASTSATTFTVNQSTLASGATIAGTGGVADTLIFSGTSFDLTSTDLDSIEKLQATSKTVTITVDAVDLAPAGTLLGGSGTDTLIVQGVAVDLTSTTLSSVEKLQAGSTNDTIFTVDTADLVKGGEVRGSTGSDTLIVNGTSFNLGGTVLSSVEVLQTGITTTHGTVFTVDTADLVSGSQVIGNATVGANDVLAAAGTALDISSATLTSIEKLQAGLATATTFTLTDDQLASLPVFGSTGKDTLVVIGTEFDLTSATLSSIEILKTTASQGTLFTVDQDDLASGSSVLGSAVSGTFGFDTLIVTGTSVDLTSTTLSNIDVIQAETGTDTTFKVDISDLAKGGSVLGGGGDDTLVAGLSGFDLSSTTLSSIEQLKMSNTSGSTITVDLNDLAGNVSITGSAGTRDTLTIRGTDFDLSSTSLSGVEILSATGSLATRFTVDADDLAAGGSITGGSGSDALLLAGTTIDLSSTTLSSIEKIQASNALDTTFIVDANDLAKSGSVFGSSGTDTLQAAGKSLDLTATVLSNVEILQGSSLGTTFTVDVADLAGGVEVRGSTSGIDTLSVKASSIDLTSTTLSSVEVIQAGLSPATITVDAEDLAAGGSVLGGNSKDTLIVGGALVDLTSTTLSSIDTIQAATTNATTFLLDANDFTKGGAIVAGTAAVDTLEVQGTLVDLSSVTLTSVDQIRGSATTATTFVLDTNDLAANGTIFGTAQADILKSGVALDVSSTTLLDIETIQAGTASATTFTINGSQLGTTIKGSTGTDTLAFRGTNFDLTGTTLSSVEILKATTTGTTSTNFTVDVDDLAAGGQVIGGTGGKDTLTILGTDFDLSARTLSSIEILQAGSTDSTRFTVDTADLVIGGSILGSGDIDTLAAAGSALDLSSTTLSSIEKLVAVSTNATTFTVDAKDLAADGSVLGTSKNDTLSVVGPNVDLTSTTLSSVELLKVATAVATTITLDKADLAAFGTITGNTKDDTLSVADTTIDLTSTALTSVEKIRAGTASDTIFTVDTADLASNGSILGSSGTDTLIVKGSSFNLLSATLSSVEVLQAATDATTFSVDTNDLAAGGSIIGSTATGTAGADTLAGGSSLDLSSTTLVSIEKLKSGVASGTSFTFGQDELTAGFTVNGASAGKDTLLFRGTGFDLTSTTLSSVEVLKAATTLDTVFTVDTADLASGGSVQGFGTEGGSDTLTILSTDFDLRSTTLSSVEKLQGGAGVATTFKVDASDLAANGSILGGGLTDTLQVVGSALDLSSTTLSNIEIITTGSSKATITIDANETKSGLVFQGNTSSNDTLAFTGTNFDLTNTALSSIEILRANTAKTTITIDQDDLAVGGSVLGSTATGSASADTLVMLGNIADYSSVALSSVEILRADGTTNTKFTVNQFDLAAGGSVLGAGGTVTKDELVTIETKFDLTSTTLSSVEVVTTDNTDGTQFVVDTNDLNGVEIRGGLASDTLVIRGTSLDLSSATLKDIETLQAGVGSATTFTVTDADLVTIGDPTKVTNILGSTGADTLIVRSTMIDLVGVTLSSIETIKAGATSVTTFKIDTGDLVAGGKTAGQIIGVDLSKATGTSGGTNAYDELQFVGTNIDLSSTTLSSIERLVAGNDPVKITLDQSDLSFRASNTDFALLKEITGGIGDDTLLATGTGFSLTSVGLSSIEILKAGGAGAATIIIDQLDLAVGGSVLGGTGSDTLRAGGNSLDLSATTISSIEILQAGFSPATFTVDTDDLVPGIQIKGVTGDDILAVNSVTIDLTSVTLSSVEILQSTLPGSSLSFIINDNDVASGGTIMGDDVGSDTLTIIGTSFDVSSVTLNSIDELRAGSTNATTFKVDTADVAGGISAGGIVIGTGKTDTLQTQTTEIDLTSTMMSSIEILRAGKGTATTFTVNLDDLANKGSVFGSTNADTLIITDATFDLTSTSLTSVEILQAGVANSPTLFTLDKNDLATTGTGGQIIGNALADALDTLMILGTDFDLSSTALSSIEILQTAATVKTTFTLNQNDLSAGGTIIGTVDDDIIKIKSTSFDLTSTTLQSVEVLNVATNATTKIILDQDDLLAGGSVFGNASAVDTLTIAGTMLDLTSTTASSIEKLVAGTTEATTFIVDQGDLTSGATIIGSTGEDTLQAGGTALNLSSTSLTSIEVLKANAAGADTIFTVNQKDLASGGSVMGDFGIDTLSAADTSLNLASSTLSSIEILSTGLTTATTFIVDQSDLYEGGSVLGAAGSDTLQTAGNLLDLRSVTLSSVETISAGTTLATHFYVDDDGGGLKITGSTNNSDVFEFTTGYGLDDVTNDASILADTATITNFNVASTTELIDVSALTDNGTATFQALSGSDQTAINVAGSLKAALDIAATALDGTTNTLVTSFTFGGATYALIDNSGTAGVTTNDAVIKLTGALTLGSTDFLLS